jgi:hypothetical protein
MKGEANMANDSKSKSSPGVSTRARAAVHWVSNHRILTGFIVGTVVGILLVARSAARLEEQFPEAGVNGAATSSASPVERSYTSRATAGAPWAAAGVGPVNSQPSPAPMPSQGSRVPANTKANGLPRVH